MNGTDNVRIKLLLALLLMFVLYIISTLFYHFVEGWSYLDSVYFVTTTFTTIGFGDHVPVTVVGKVFTILIAWIGVSTGFFLIYNIMTYRETVVDQHIIQKLSIFRQLTSSEDKQVPPWVKKKI